MLRPLVRIARQQGAQRPSELVFAETARIIRTRPSMVLLLLGTAVPLALGVGQAIYRKVSSPAPDLEGIATAGADIFAFVAALTAAIGVGRDYQTGAIGFRMLLIPRRGRLLAASALGHSGVAAAIALLAMLIVGVFATVFGGTSAPFSADSVAAIGRSIAAVALVSCFGAGLGYAVRSATVAAIVIITLFWLAPITLLIAGMSGVPGAASVANITLGILVGQAVSATPELGGNLGPWGALLLLVIWSSGVLLLAALRLKGK
ncbi:hypothetical protein [Arthrobacter bambusae]|uniref:hypothetical protein n=1 Tax=Arthrobacter bambusae TaxID=1338426 RepID=UPI002787EF09|nr:hypothetical protein [Arthrobacter bambusae]MDQ0028959.1 hypothetical protein [Arthrobacter bambusae]MDQ0098639.1 hypothetical protein [Arthrobacter bambusae]